MPKYFRSVEAAEQNYFTFY